MAVLLRLYESWRIGFCFNRVVAMPNQYWMRLVGWVFLQGDLPIRLTLGRSVDFIATHFCIRYWRGGW